MHLIMLKKYFIKIILLVYLCLILTNCGSIYARDRRQNFFSAPLYCGVYHDTGVFPLFLLDMPFSFVLDTIFAPVDLISYAEGNDAQCSQAQLRIVGL